MADISKPDYTYLWSSGGIKVSPSNSKIQTGWTAEVPPYQWENWSQYRQDQAIAHILQHGLSVWDNTTEYQAGRSYVQGSDGIIYKALTTNTNTNPVTDGGVNWVTDIVPSATTTSKGIVELATSTEVLQGVDAVRAVTPASILTGLLGACNLSSSGYTTLPINESGVRKNLIIQWGQTPATDVTGLATQNLPVTFPTAHFQAVCVFTNAARLGVSVQTASLTTTQIQVFATTSSTGAALSGAFIKWIAVGT